MFQPECLCCLSSNSPSHPIVEYFVQRKTPTISLSSTKDERVWDHLVYDETDFISPPTALPKWGRNYGEIPYQKTKPSKLVSAVNRNTRAGDQAQSSCGVTLLLPRVLPVLHTHGTVMMLRAVHQKLLPVCRTKHTLQWLGGKQFSEQMWLTLTLDGSSPQPAPDHVKVAHTKITHLIRLCRD